MLAPSSVSINRTILLCKSVGTMFSEFPVSAKAVARRRNGFHAASLGRDKPRILPGAAVAGPKDDPTHRLLTSVSQHSSRECLPLIALTGQSAELNSLQSNFREIHLITTHQCRYAAGSGPW